MSCDENSFKHNKQTSSSGAEVRTKTHWKQSLSCPKVRFSSPEVLMEDLPFFCGWGWDFSLSLEKEFEGAAGVILRWISSWVVKLLQLHDAQLWRIFSFKYRSMHSVWFYGIPASKYLCFFLCLGVELYTHDLVKFLRRRLFQDIFFNSRWRDRD